ncbi:SDR family NAD(P)-dependent oxidoreductase [uncultured Psychrobacter sp.]|uniref:SDR family NAD(P)-dependent oxidoreductase n=1 Tax=uncultured Psychrobacter sp. TaxID=259303 RepID=UPI002594FDCF|nr:SDR family NAD(P)-dependent oxidoreductase [uncultured Psychrobacter sp.]
MAIIFGGASGLGEATAKAFANEGAKVVVTGRDEVAALLFRSQIALVVANMIVNHKKALS